MSDTHWGFDNKPALNPDARGTLPKAIATINGLEHQPDFVVFTGDLTHTTDDAQVRRDRMLEFRELVSTLHVKQLRFLPGEHDASLDGGAVYKEVFGDLHYSFDHEGIHFIALDNASDPRGKLGDAQLAWLGATLNGRDREAPLVVLAHRPLFPLHREWGWTTEDSEEALKLLMPFRAVTVFYGHIHQEHHHNTNHIAHHSARSLIFPLPAPGSVPKRKALPWDAQEPYRGLGVREIGAVAGSTMLQLAEHPVVKS